MKSVLVLTPWFPDCPGDRQGNFVYDSVLALSGQGMSVAVVVARPWVPSLLRRLRPGWLQDNFKAGAFGEVNVQLVRFFRVPQDRCHWLARLSRRYRLTPVVEEMAKRRVVDVIHAHTEEDAATAVAVGKKLNIPVVVTLHGLNTGPRHFTVAERKRYRAALNAANRVILVGEPLRPFFRSIAGRDDHFRVVANGFRLPQKPPRPRFAAPDATIRFISISNLHEGKGVEDALSALAIAKQRGFTDWEYTLVGDGGQRSILEGMAASRGISGQVRFLGIRQHDEVYELLDQADVFLLPSYRESFGIAYLEAMGSGLLAIGVKGQGPEAFIADGKTGLLVEPRNPDLLADTIIEIVSSRPRMRDIAAAGAAFVRREFTWEMHAKRLLDVYRELAP